MPWVKLDDGFDDHEKVVELFGIAPTPLHVLAALGLYTLTLTYSGRKLTDGFVARGLPGRFGGTQEVVDLLVESGLWEKRENGWQIHDYLDYNPSREQVLNEREWAGQRNALHKDRDLIAAIRARDGDLCRYCGMEVDWTNRRGPKGGTYDHVIPRGPNSLENVVVACRRCNSTKGNRPLKTCGLQLLPPPTQVGADSDSGPSKTPEPEPEPGTTSRMDSASPSSVAAERGQVVERPEVVALCEQMADALAAQGVGKRPDPHTKKWHDATRRLLDLDGATVKQVEYAIRWTTAHTFWASVVRSMPKLREKWGSIALQIRQEKEGIRRTGGTARDRAGADMRDMAAIADELREQGR